MKIAITFPGQGSQSVGMLSTFADRHPEIVRTYREASDVLGFDLWHLVQHGPDSQLNLTENTQPAVLAGAIAVWRVWRSFSGSTPAVLAGHSLGEYAALVAADALDFDAAVRLVATRGSLMQAAVAPGEGAVAAVLGLDDERVSAVCAATCGDQVVAAANFNAPGQVVIAGQRSAVDRALLGLREAGARRGVVLPLSVPVHCELMESAARGFAAYLNAVAFRQPNIPVIHNVDVQTRDAPGAIRLALAEQVHKPVRWTQTVCRMVEEGVDTILELGPGKVLTGLARRIDRTLTALPVGDPESLEKALEHARGGA